MLFPIWEFSFIIYHHGASNWVMHFDYIEPKRSLQIRFWAEGETFVEDDDVLVKKRDLFVCNE